MYVKNGIGILQKDRHSKVDARCLSHRIVSIITTKRG
jgi:hypothetical protein